MIAIIFSLSVMLHGFIIVATLFVKPCQGESIKGVSDLKMCVLSCYIISSSSFYLKIVILSVQNRQCIFFQCGNRIIIQL